MSATKKTAKQGTFRTQAIVALLCVLGLYVVVLFILLIIKRPGAPMAFANFVALAVPLVAHIYRNVTFAEWKDARKASVSPQLGKICLIPLYFVLAGMAGALLWVTFYSVEVDKSVVGYSDTITVTEHYPIDDAMSTISIVFGTCLWVILSFDVFSKLNLTAGRQPAAQRKKA